jgi:hypothetical protein
VENTDWLVPKVSLFFLCRDIIDHNLNTISGNVELKGKDVIIQESTNSGFLEDDHVPQVVSNQTPKKRFQSVFCFCITPKRIAMTMCIRFLEMLIFFHVEHIGNANVKQQLHHQGSLQGLLL